MASRKPGPRTSLRPPSRGKAEPLPPIDAEGILRTLAEVRKVIPKLDGVPGAPAPKRTDERFISGALDVNSLREFDYQAVTDGLESVTAELSAALDAAQQKMLDQALDVYYAAVELARDPVHAEMIPHVEQMRRAYEQSYGRPIPSREETEAERRRRGRK
ncbi:MAG: hypothetical protein JWN02_866 [Acidobacteria bacterium]|nr:hypothetical protein [Acidobacteriota bacterium]